MKWKKVFFIFPDAIKNYWEIFTFDLPKLIHFPIEKHDVVE